MLLESSKLDQELYDLFVAPVLENQRQALIAGDRALAKQLNEAEAEEVEALFDCECCYSSVTFEQMSTCDDGCHQLCFDCVRRAVSEALFGQGWARAVDLERSTVRCFAPTLCECQGIIPSSVLRPCICLTEVRVMILGNEFSSREQRVRIWPRVDYHCSAVRSAVMSRSMKLQWRKGARLWLYRHHLATRTSIAFQFGLLCLVGLLLIFTIPLLLLGSVAWLAVMIVPQAAAVFGRSWARVHRQRRGPQVQMPESELQQNIMHPMPDTMERSSHMLRDREDIITNSDRIFSNSSYQNVHARSASSASSNLQAATSSSATAATQCATSVDKRSRAEKATHTSANIFGLMAVGARSVSDAIYMVMKMRRLRFEVLLRLPRKLGRRRRMGGKGIRGRCRLWLKLL